MNCHCSFAVWPLEWLWVLSQSPAGNAPVLPCHNIPSSRKKRLECGCFSGVQGALRTTGLPDPQMAFSGRTSSHRSTQKIGPLPITQKSPTGEIYLFFLSAGSSKIIPIHPPFVTLIWMQREAGNARAPWSPMQSSAEEFHSV